MAINLVIGIPITFAYFPWFLLSPHFWLRGVPSIYLAQCVLLLIAGVCGFFGGMHLLRNRRQFRGFLIASGISWLAMSLLMVKFGLLTGGIPYVVGLANANLIFVALDLRTRRW